jgi:RND family efflux transporter MFP subunit
MKKYTLAVSGLALLGALTVSCGKSEDTSASDSRVISVKAEVVQPENVKLTGAYTGSLDGEKQAVIYSKISEAVEDVNVDEGQMVKTNATVITLDKSGPSSSYQQAKSLYQNAEKNYKKMEYLFKEGAISETNFDAAQTDYEVKKAAFESAAQLVEIKSPISGMVTSVDVSPGDYVQIGQKLATIATTDKLRVKFGVNASDIGLLKLGARVTISSEMSPNTAQGSIVSVPTSADPVTRAFDVEAIVENADGHFKPGMFVRIDFVRQNLDNVIVVPQNAVLTLDNVPTVFLVSGDTADKRQVKLGPDVHGNVVVDSGLTAGDTLVTLGQDYLEEGFKVRITSMSEGNR